MKEGSSTIPTRKLFSLNTFHFFKQESLYSDYGRGMFLESQSFQWKIED